MTNYPLETLKIGLRDVRQVVKDLGHLKEQEAMHLTRIEKQYEKAINFLLLLKEEA